MVRAYKGLLKEKEALEATIKALSVQQSEGDKRDCDDVQEDGGTEQEGAAEEKGREEECEQTDVSDKVLSRRLPQPQVH